MKKWLSCLFAALLLLCLTACNPNSAVSNDSSDATTTTTAQQNTNATTDTSYDAEQSEEYNTAIGIYNDFLTGKITAVYGDNSNVDIDYLAQMATPHTLSYDLFDRNGDSVPELCIKNEVFISTFWVEDGALKLWREENSDSKILSNGNYIEVHYGGAPNHIDHSYGVYSYTGKLVCSFTVSVLTKNGVDVLEDVYTQHTYIYTGNAEEIGKEIEISKEQYDAIRAAMDKIGEANMDWKPIE